MAWSGKRSGSVLHRRLRASFLILCTLFFGLARAAFDPVHEDIDIFMVNPAINADRPNVLIILDNTANWNQAFVNEKSALVSLINGLNADFNVGLGMYVETGGGNDNVDGAYIRFAVRQMAGTPQTTLSTVVNNLSQGGDKGNNNTIGLALSEVYKYFAGGTSHSSYGKIKTDYAGNAANAAGNLAGNALPASPTASSLFVSPVASNCQKNYLIYIGNGKFNENSSALATAEARLQAAQGIAPQTIAISPNGQQGNWADEWARFMAKTGFTKTLNGETKRIFVNTYAVAIDPGEQNLWGSGSTAGTNDSLRLMKSMSEDNGNGKYFEVSSGNGGSEIVAALTRIFNEIQAVNSVFAATTLPVSVNVRGTNLNQVYIGMFRPDANKAPRWVGNLKMYKLAADSSGNLYLADAASSRVEDPVTGFVGRSNRSFWTHDSSFWSFRTANENGAGGSSDSPDGDLVEKGAVAQWLRENNALAQDDRKLYTCTSGSVACSPCAVTGSGSTQACGNGSALSATPFAIGNDGITPINLGLGTKDVSSLSARVTRSVASLTDRRPVSLNNSIGTSTTVTLGNGAITGSISQLSTALTRSLSALSGLSSIAIASATAASAGGGNFTYTFTTASSHGLSAGDSVQVSGVSQSNYNSASWTVASVPGATTFTVTAPSNEQNGSGGTVSRKTVVARATLANHGFADADPVTIAGASPAAFNGTFGVTVIDANTFTYTLPSAQGAAATVGTVTGTSTTATATTAAAHGLSAGQQVIIAGASPGGYNGTFTVLASPAPTANTFSYAVSGKLSPNTATGVSFYRNGTGGSTVTATSATAHNLANGTTYALTGPNSCFTGSFSVSVTGANTFTYTTPVTCTTAPGGSYTVSGTTTGATVTATLANHNFGTQCAGGNVAIYGTDINHAGTWGPITVVDTNTFTYSTTTAKPLPSGSFTAACASAPRAFATASGHGFGTGDAVTVTGVDTTGGNAGNAVYNTTASLSAIDADNFSYPLAGAAAGAASGPVTAAKDSTTALAYVANHGFANGSSVVISGATPAAFNGTWNIAVTGNNTFTYTLGSPLGDASGAILAAAGTGSTSERDQIIHWVRGQDNNEDENRNGSATDCRASVHGDVLHSRPAVINYNRYGGDNDVYIFYGANDGVFRAIKGGAGTDAGDTAGLQPGYEAWGFVPEESFTQLKRLRNNTPVIGSALKKPYFMDGPIGVYSLDADVNGKLQAGAAGDKVYLYIGARRGGRFIYSMDVTDPLAPRYRWRIGNATPGFGELGYTWSQATVVTGINGYTNPVLIFGGGYDPAVEDIENCTIQSATATTVRYYSGAIKYTATGCTKDNGSAIGTDDSPSTTVSRGMGRAIYMVDAITGELLWWAGRPGSGANLEVSGLDFAIAGDPAVIRNQSGGLTNHAYFGDTGGNVWRFDFGSSDRSQWKLTRITALANLASSAERRKFLYPPDVVSMSGYDAVLIGSGDREHPFDMSVTNRFYLLKDKGNDNGPLTGVDNAEGSATPTLTEARLYDATSVSRSTASSTATAAQKTAASAAGTAGSASADGWYVSFAAGEKDVGNAVALNGTVFFNTNVSPMSPDVSSSEICASNLGIANQYQIDIANASTQVSTHAGGGYLPSPVHVVVLADVTTTDPATGQPVTTQVPIEGVVSGTEVKQPSGVKLGNRTRRFWYKEID